MVEKHKNRKNQQTFYKRTMCNNAIMITLYCITTRKAAKEKRDIVNAVDGQGLANNYDKKYKDGPISEVPSSCLNKK